MMCLSLSPTLGATQSEDATMADDDRKKSKRRPTRGSSRSDAAYKRDLENLFKSGGDVPDRFKGMMERLEPEEGSEEAEWKAAVDALRSTEGFREFVAAVAEFRTAGHALPDDEDLLIRLLDHPDERVVRDVLAHYKDLHRRRGLDRSGPLKSRLKTIETMSEDPRTLRLVAEIRELV